MKNIPFDISYRPRLEAKDKGLSLVTKEGRPVEILKWDAKGNYPIVGLVTPFEGYEYEEVHRWDNSGIEECVNSTCCGKEKFNLHILMTDVKPFSSIFKEGDRIRHKNREFGAFKIKEISDHSYIGENGESLDIFFQDEWELVPKTKEYINSKPRFKSGDEIYSRLNPSIKYKILLVGIKNELGTLDYKAEYIGNDEFNGKIRYMEIQKVDSWGEKLELPELNEFERELSEILFYREYEGPTETDEIDSAYEEFDKAALELAPRLLEKAKIVLNNKQDNEQE